MASTRLRAWLSTWGAAPAESHNYQRLQIGEDGEVTEMRIRNENATEERDEEGLEPKIHEGTSQDMDV